MSGTLKTVLSSLKKISQSADAEHVAAYSVLLGNMSYRLPASAALDRLIGFRMLRRTRQLFQNGQTAITATQATDSKYALLDSSSKHFDLQLDYLKKQAGITPGICIAKSALPSEIENYDIGSLWPWYRFALWTAIRCLFSSNRANMALLIPETIELSMLMSILKKHNIQYVFDYAPYEVDSNWSALLMRSLGIHVTKVPSPGPLSTHNHTIVGNKLVLSTPYQFDELEILNHIFVEEVVKWVPEKTFEFVQQYIDNDRPTQAKTLAFYSHGSWIRSHEGHANDGLNIGLSEKHLLDDLKQFVSRNPEYSITIYPHPREKTADYWAKTKAYYSEIFGENQVAFAGKDEKTADHFDSSDIALAAFSTILYERMFCGYKTLIGNYGESQFPIAQSPLNSICFNSYDQMERLILKASVATGEEFMKEQGILDYWYKSYDYFQDN